jgi:hypothetical protein
VNTNDTKLGLRYDDEDIAHLAGEVEIPAIRNRRCREALAALRETLAELNAARFSIETGKDAEIVAGEK